MATDICSTYNISDLIQSKVCRMQTHVMQEDRLTQLFGLAEMFVSPPADT